MFNRYFSKLRAPIITITENAWKKLGSITKTQKGKGFIFSAESGGCNGFNYKLKMFKEDYEVENLINCIKTKKLEKTSSDYNQQNEINKKLINFKLSKIENHTGGVTVYIDPLSEMYLLGTNIDYKLEDIENGIYESKFVFNPDKNFATTCGCGISFNPK